MVVFCSSTAREKLYLQTSQSLLSKETICSDRYDSKENLTIGVDFINILRTRFSYKSALHCFSLITARLCDFSAKGYWQKMRVKC